MYGCWLRQQIGIVSQEPALFTTTILENMLLGRLDAPISRSRRPPVSPTPIPWSYILDLCWTHVHHLPHSKPNLFSSKVSVRLIINLPCRIDALVYGPLIWWGSSAWWVGTDRTVACFLWRCCLHRDVSHLMGGLACFLITGNLNGSPTYEYTLDQGTFPCKCASIAMVLVPYQLKEQKGFCSNDFLFYLLVTFLKKKKFS